MKRAALIATLALFLMGGGTASAYTLKHPKREHCRAHYVRHGKQCVKPKPKAPEVFAEKAGPELPPEPFTPARPELPLRKEVRPPSTQVADWGVAAWTDGRGTTATATETASVSEPIEGETKGTKKAPSHTTVIGHEIARTLTLTDADFKGAATVTIEVPEQTVLLSEHTTTSYTREACVAVVLAGKASCTVTEFLPVRKEVTEPTEPPPPKEGEPETVPRVEPETKLTELPLVGRYPGAASEVEQIPMANGTLWQLTTEWLPDVFMLNYHPDGVYTAG